MTTVPVSPESSVSAISMQKQGFVHVGSAPSAPKKIVNGSLMALAALSFAALSAAFSVMTPEAAQEAESSAEAGAAMVNATAVFSPAWHSVPGALGLLLMLGCALRALWPSGRVASSALMLGCFAAAACWLALPPSLGDVPAAAGYWLGIIALAFLAAVSVQRCAQFSGGWADAWLAATVFGLWVLVFWQLLVVSMGVPRVILPAPWGIGQALMDQRGLLTRDFMQTVVKAVFSGWLMGCALGFLVALAIDRQPFLQRGLLPIASLTSTVPLVAVAPITVMWFGFGWESKAAVVVLMTFFPMLVSTLAGLKAADKLEQELMFTYAASYKRTLLDLRLPSAFPFVVGALKVNASLALIGAIVAEYFGSPTSGLGFRISTEAAKMNMSLVWGAIVVSAVTGSVAYALLVKLERKVAFWHPSVRVK
jgi:NitT/TauT family transport system permease protein